MVSSVPASQPRRVLLEDLTGVKCPNCPDAQKVAEDIVAAHPDLISLVSEHVTKLAIPLPTSKYDFRTPDANNILSTFGKDPSALPAGVINRNKYLAGGDSTFYTTYQSWAGRIEDELKNTTPVNVEINKLNYNGSTGILSGIISNNYKSDFAYPTRITLMLTESGMVDIQDISHSPGVDTAYVFKHALRKVLQPWQGLQLAAKAEKGQVYTVKFATQLAKEWVPQNMDVVTFVHRMDAGQLRILQVQEKNIQ
jgi:hypothetical protein